MPIRPVPTPSLILSDPGDLPILTPVVNYYNSSKYSCNGANCGQFVGTEIIASTSSLSLGQYYISNNLPGFVFQAVSSTTSRGGRGVETTSYRSCGTACLSVATILPSPPSSVTPTPTKTPTPTRTPSATPSRSVGASQSPTPSITRTPSITPSITSTPSVTPSITVSPSITPSITVTPSVTPFSSPQFGIYVTCSFQILNTVPTASSATSNLTGSITGSLPSSVTTTGIFIPSSSFQTSMINFFPQASTQFNMGLTFAVPIGPSAPGGSIGYELFPDSLVVANSTAVTSSRLVYHPEPNDAPNEGAYIPIVDYTDDVRLSTSYVLNRFGLNDIQFFALRIRVYKNSYLIFDSVRTHYNNQALFGTSAYSEPFYFYIPYGTLCNNDEIKVVYSLA